MVVTWWSHGHILVALTAQLLHPCVPCRDIDMDEFLPDDPDIQRAHPHTKYDLIANICHDGAAGMNQF